MPIDLQQFIQRAGQGAGRIRLSGKPSARQSPPAPVLSRHKGSLGGRVVEWLRGSTASRAAENRQVTTLFLDAIKAAYGQTGLRAVSARIGVDEGKPLTSSDVRVYTGLAEQAVLERNKAQQDLEVVVAHRCAEPLAAFFPSEGDTGAFALINELFEAAETKDFAKRLEETLRDPLSEASQAIVAHVQKAVRSKLELGADIGDSEIATALRFAFKAQVFGAAAKDEAGLRFLLQRPWVTLANEQLSVRDDIKRLLKNPVLHDNRKAWVAARVVAVATDLAQADGADAAYAGSDPPLTRADHAQQLVDMVLHADDGFYRLLNKAERAGAFALKRDLDSAQAGRTNDRQDRLMLLEKAAVAECARLALAPAHADFRALDGLEQRAVVALGGRADAFAPTTQTHRDLLFQLRAQAANLGHGVSGLEQQAFISSQMRRFTARLIEDAVRALGEPPHRFEALTLGSTSRGEASPYSDIEFAFVVPGHLTAEQVAAARDHLQRVATLMRFYVTALGEFGLYGLPEKLHWDPAGLTPDKDPMAFIGRPADLVKLGFKAGPDGEPLNPEMFTMYANAEWLYGEAGQDGVPLANAFHEATRAHLNRSADTNGRQTRGSRLGNWLLTQALEAPGDMLPSVLRRQIALGNPGADANGVEVNVKRLSRLPMMLVQSLCLTHGVHDSDAAAGMAGPVHSTAMRVQALVERGVLRRDQAERLMTAFDILARVRTQAHLRNASAVDTVQLEDHPELRQAIDLLVPFEQSIAHQLGRSGRP
ncbi:DUF294 nucleotidyltransferase-like domain-containing protein [Hydrogenophaga sp. T2]|uniref:DUF294 nucleotidyltransferase-like domain-containing protein n=1 Tax=Hydrogenophaga sp. T2 TaxID=3132823 RepID=UPI003CF999BB